MIDRKKVEDFAKAAGADLFAAAGIERFEELPPDKHPRAVFPETKSVIMLGRRIPRGALRGVEEGTQFGGYSQFGLEWLDNRFLPMTTFTVSEFLEDAGWEAVPLQNLPKEVPPMGVSVAKGKPEPNVMLDFDDAAVRAGMGEIGYCGALLTPRFGPRQRLQMILTDAEITPDELLKEPVCPGPGKCEGFCPLGAYEGHDTVKICGKEMTVARIDYKKCAKCRNGAKRNLYHPAGKPDRLAAVCMRSCVDFLEHEKLIKNNFENRFRKRDAWCIKNEETDFYSL